MESFNLNECGKEYSYQAARGDYSFGMLSEEIRSQQKALEDLCSKNFYLAAEKRARITSCMDKLSASLLQIFRINQFHNRLIAWAQEKQLGTDVAIAFAAKEACWDFEALLLHGKATLDRLAWFIASEFQNQCSRISRLPNILKDFSRKDRRAEELLSILNENKSLEGILIATEQSESLRDFVAHLGGIAEDRKNYFSICYIAGNRVLICDCESRNFPIIRTTLQISRILPFIVLNSLSVVASVERIPLEKYDPPWQNQTVVVSDYIIESSQAPVLSMINGTLDGFTIISPHVKESIFQHSINIP